MKPRFPLSDANVIDKYLQKGFLVNLKPGDYIVSIKAENVKDKKWFFRAVSSHVTLTVLE